MGTSGSTNYATSRDNLIKGALRLIGVLAQGETPSTDQVTEASEALNFLVKAWQADGMPLWGIKEYELTLTASTAKYRIGLSQTVNISKPLRIISAYRSTGTTDTPLTIITRDEYNRLGTKSNTGYPIQLYYDVQNTYGDLYVNPVPDATVAADSTITIVYQRSFEDFDAAADEPDFPQEWFDALKYGLATRLAPEYGVPVSERQLLLQEMTRIKQEALSMGTEEGSIFFAPDIRSY